MAIDVYLQLGEIKGESTDEAHKGWIECESVTWGVTQPRSPTASTAGGHTAERAELSDISFHKLADLASPILFQACAMGRTFPKAKFEFFRADGQGVRVKYYEIELENALIAHVAPGVASGVGMTEHVGLKFSKIRLRYTQQRIGGGAAGNTVGGWDLATNRMA